MGLALIGRPPFFKTSQYIQISVLTVENMANMDELKACIYRIHYNSAVHMLRIDEPLLPPANEVWGKVICL